MRKHLAQTAIYLILMAGSASAESVKSSFFTNDFIGDGNDRWRSASYTRFYGFTGDRTGGIPYDLRIRGEIISPWGDNQQAQDDDRPYAGVLGFGAFANHRIGFTDINAGAEIVMMGDQTGLPRFQNGFHEAFGFDGYMPEEDTHMHIPDKFSGAISAEVATNYYVGQKGSVRPFVAGHFGYETYLRAGVDMMWGGYSYAEQYVRDPVSGFIQPSSPTRSSAMEGFTIIGGFDYSAMTSSDFFPDDADVEIEPGRLRARLGIQSLIGPASVFYGATFLGEEFKTQSEGQTVGTLSIEIPL